MSGGAPTAYRAEFCAQAQKLCLLGATDAELASFFEVSTRTIYRWINEYPEFCQALKVAKDEADKRVERSLYHRAVGYSYEAVKIFLRTNDEVPVYAPYTEHVPPDTTAMIFWLKNRQSAKWRDVHKYEHGRPGDFDDESDEKLREIIRSETGSLGARRPRRSGIEAASDQEGMQPEPSKVH